MKYIKGQSVSFKSGDTILHGEVISVETTGNEPIYLVSEGAGSQVFVKESDMLTLLNGRTNHSGSIITG